MHDAAGTTPTTKSRERFAYADRRCAEPRCRCILARDNTQPYCSPCQRRHAGIQGPDR